jgi:hypothetical protein
MNAEVFDLPFGLNGGCNFDLEVNLRVEVTI